jgi:hypothetical protein
MRCPDFTDTSLARPVLAYVSDWPVIGTLLKAVPGLSQQAPTSGCRPAWSAIRSGFTNRSTCPNGCG